MLNRLKSHISEKHCTLLGIGVMSKNVIDVTIELASDYNIPLMLIASRRQIEAEKFGGGYVNTTEDFAKYIRDNDKSHNILLCRDHGGLWQNNFEKGFTYEETLKSAKESFRVDIESGFDILHIDTSISPNKIMLKESTRRLCELYEFCDNISPKNIMFEIGSEEQSGNIQNIDDLKYVIRYVYDFCEFYGCRFPTFVVTQTGTKVLETQNIGNFDNNHEEIKEIVQICKEQNILLKQHNTDYLSDRSLKWHPKLGIHVANVAPEFGVIETRTLIQILEVYKLYDIVNKFLELSYESKKWEKWMMPNSIADKRQKSIISGHYVFSDPEFLKLKYIANEELKKHNIDLDKTLKLHVKSSILRYLTNFNMI